MAVGQEKEPVPRNRLFSLAMWLSGGEGLFLRLGLFFGFLVALGLGGGRFALPAAFLQDAAGELMLALVALAAQAGAATSRALGGRLLGAQLQQHQAPGIA